MAFVIAIDGPAGAGKSTVARRIALALKFMYLDTGAMYRSVAWMANRQGVGEESPTELTRIARDLTIVFSDLTADGAQRVTVNGEDVTSAIRTPEITTLTSHVSAISSVRAVVVEQQRKIASSAETGVVLEGRDIGTVVFPFADLKVFLTATPEERARRRAAELQKRGISADQAITLAEMQERDERDTHRRTSPLTMASDAIPVDTDGATIDQVVDKILTVWKARAA